MQFKFTSSPCDICFVDCVGLHDSDEPLFLLLYRVQTGFTAENGCVRVVGMPVPLVLLGVVIATSFAHVRNGHSDAKSDPKQNYRSQSSYNADQRGAHGRLLLFVTSMYALHSAAGNRAAVVRRLQLQLISHFAIAVVN